MSVFLRIIYGNIFIRIYLCFSSRIIFFLAVVTVVIVSFIFFFSPAASSFFFFFFFFQFSIQGSWNFFLLFSSVIFLTSGDIFFFSALSFISKYDPSKMTCQILSRRKSNLLVSIVY